MWLNYRGKGHDRLAPKKCQLAIALTRAVNREILRLAVFLWIAPFCAERANNGAADFNASSAVSMLPAAIASSTLRTSVRVCEVRALVDLSAADRLTSGFLRRLGVGHNVNPS